jgi:hypothetical protein
MPLKIKINPHPQAAKLWLLLTEVSEFGARQEDGDDPNILT